MQNNTHVSNSILKYIWDGNAEEFQNELRRRGLNLPPKEFENTRELVRYLKSLDLQTILDVGKTCCCIFHSDEKPSASIYQGSSGDWLYACHSGNCMYAGKAMNIMQLVQAYQKSNKSKAYEFLQKSFNVKLKLKPDDDDAVSSENLFVENISVLDDMLEELAPTASKFIDRSVLTALYSFGWEQMDQIDCTGRKSITFSISNNQLRQKAESPNMKASIYLAQFAYMGFIHRIPLYELDTKRYNAMMNYLREMKKDNQSSGEKKNWMLSTNQIQVFRLTKSKLKEIEVRAKQWVELGYCISTFTYRCVYEKEGSFKAHEVMPYGNRLWLKKGEVPFQELKDTVIQVLDRELAKNSSIKLQDLKRIVRKETGGSPKQIQLYLKIILDKLCEISYCRAKVGRITVIQKRNSEKQHAA